jgi:4-hydroxyphenylpyruvate dioxygenase
MERPREEISDWNANDFLQLKGYDYIELYVGNVHQAAHFYRTAFGFTPIAYAGLETGISDHTSYVLAQRNIRLLLTSPLHAESPIAEHVNRHGDGIKDIAFTVKNATQAFEETVRRGARPVLEPTVSEDSDGRVVKSAIGVYGDTVHSFVQRHEYEGVFLPGFLPVASKAPLVATGFSTIDHVAISLEAGELDHWVNFYGEVMGFHESHTENVETEYSAMNSKVVQSSTGRIKFPMVEPSPSKRRSQIDEYLEFYQGAGVQHVALLTSDIIKTVEALRAMGNEFLRTPETYYEMLNERVGNISEDLSQLRALNILVDRDEWGYLMQIFTKPVQSRPTVFMEAIQRKGAKGFGSGNIKALFQALEREQALRGNL